MNVYEFHVSLVDNSDRRKRERLRHNQEGSSLVQAWDQAEERIASRYPDHSVVMSVGNRQPLHLRPGYQEAERKRRALATLGEVAGLIT